MKKIIEQPYKYEIKQIAKTYNTDCDIGLKQSEIEERKEDYGINSVSSGKQISPWEIFLNQFKDLLIYILIFAAGLSFFMKDTTEAIAIVVVILLNAVLGFFQEYRADASVKAIQSLVNPACQVIRDGERLVVKNEDLVPGDIVLLESGNKIPADIRVVSCTGGFKVDESMLTGESISINKTTKEINGENLSIGDLKNLCFMGTIVTEGKAKGLVVATGNFTELGKIASLTREVKEEKTPLEKRMDVFSKKLSIILGVVCIVVFVLNWANGAEFHETLLFAIALAVAAIPESLPAVTTIVLSNGVSRMSKHNAIVKKLASVETLGSTTVICTDKTGTLTENNMKPIKIIVNGKEEEIPVTISQDKTIKSMQEVFYFSNDATISHGKQTGDPTEVALLEIGLPLDEQFKENRFKRKYENPFDSSRKMMSVAIQNGNIDKMYTKGAYEQVSENCTHILLDGEIKEFNKEIKTKMDQQVLSWSKNGYRILAAAFKENTIDTSEKDLVFVGVAALRDPIRKEVFPAIKKCQDSGIRVIMVTGDHAETAKAYARELGITDEKGIALTHHDIVNLSDSELLDELKHCSVFARINPEDKYRIVSLLKSCGEIVAMTGDGVNDAPALRKADIGVAMGQRGTDLAREVSELVLLDDNFATIVEAIEEGRVIFDNIKKTIFFLLSCNIGEILLVVTAILLGMPAPLGALQLLWLNLITDSFPALALGFEKADSDVMKPRKVSDNNFLDASFLSGIIFQGVLIATGALIIFLEYQHGGATLDPFATTACFAGLVTIELFRALSARSQKQFLFHIGFFTNPFVIYAQLISFSFLLVALYGPIARNFFGAVPIGFRQWTNILLISLGVLLLAEIRKLFLKRKNAKE